MNRSERFDLLRRDSAESRDLPGKIFDTSVTVDKKIAHTNTAREGLGCKPRGRDETPGLMMMIALHSWRFSVVIAFGTLSSFFT